MSVKQNYTIQGGTEFFLTEQNQFCLLKVHFSTKKPEKTVKA